MLDATCEVNLIIEVRCPTCEKISTYHQLDSAHSNIKNNMKKMLNDASCLLNVSCKCHYCDSICNVNKVSLI